MSHYEDYISKYQNDGTSHLTSKWLQLLDNKGNRNHTESEVKIIKKISTEILHHLGTLSLVAQLLTYAYIDTFPNKARYMIPSLPKT